MFKDLYELFSGLWNHIRFKSPEIQHFDWFDFVLKLLISIGLWFLFRAYLELRNKIKEQQKDFDEKMTAMVTISNTRGRRLFIQGFDNIQYFRVPNETEQELWERLPQGGLYRNNLIEEYNLVRNKMIKKFPNKPIIEIEQLIKRFYPKSLFQ